MSRTIAPGWVVSRNVPVARKNLLADRVRMLVSVGGVTFAVVLILVVQSLYRGFDKQLGEFVDQVPADVWVMEPNMNGLMYPSMLPVGLEARVAAVDGVGGVIPLDLKRMTVTYDGKTTDTTFISYDVPADVAAGLGLDVPEPGTLIIDNTFAQLTGLGRGDTLTIAGRQMTIAAIADVSSVGLSQITIMSPSDAADLVVVPGYVAYILVSSASGEDAATLAERIQSTVPGTKAMTSAAFAEANRAEVSNTFLEIVGVLLVVSFLVGTAVVGITIYTATVERAREYGVLKAIGASTGQLLRIVMTQSVIVGLAGFAIGIPMTYLANAVANHFVPQFTTLVLTRDVATVFAAALGMAILATVIPLRRIVRIDPAAVFRA